ncbi:hypothetical protein IWZ03DRAFT_108858 [Phyllosticta citriasiana]|uniref:BHLH domain-containing protein n=1 Tax=Phyllosticta citriasiana TaxID=595635 RepID=A0ABR1KWS5_9PEZI
MSQAQALPSIASLTNALPHDHHQMPHRHHSDARDSGNWSISQTQSKHSSGVSNTTGLQLQTILNAEDSPSRNSIPETPHSVRHLSQAPTSLPSFNHTFENRQSLDASSSHLESRRSSVDSRMNAGMSHLAISPSSPYESQNASRVSLVSTLQQQRGITNDQRPNGAPPPLSPLGPRTSLRANQPPRRAPVINPNPRSVSGMPDPMAAAPTKGFPWAFPDQAELDDRRGSSSGDSSIERSTRSIPSRQNSFATSINSSIYNVDAQLPPGQKRFDDEIPHTHHHSMQHRNVTSLQAEHPPSAGTGNYSRTPELRVSHKMAERKRRSEMKTLFDELNGILPSSAGSKSSKWEILTKSIDYIKSLQRNYDRLQADNTRIRQESAAASMNGRPDDLARENAELKHELHAAWTQLRQMDPNHPHVYGQMTNYLAQQHNQAPAQNGPSQQNVLPPLQQHPMGSQWTNGTPAQQTTAMQGVEFAGGRAYNHR